MPERGDGPEEARPSAGSRTGIVGRRSVLAGAAVLGAGLVSQRAPTHAEAAPSATSTRAARAARVPFHGRHQAGIATTQQRHLVFAAFDLRQPGRASLRSLLARWTSTAERLTAGLSLVDATGETGPADTGETADSPAAALTLTVGFGPSLFDERLGLHRHGPPGLRRLPAFRGDQLDGRRCDGDLGVQACAEDPQVAFHAIRNLARVAGPTVAMRWWQIGFLPDGAPDTTPRNLLGFKDGTANVSGTDEAALRAHVWVAPHDGPDWLVDGSYLVVRRIRMDLPAWDSSPRSEQEATFGRFKGSGAPLTGQRELQRPDFGRRDAHGRPVIPLDAHIRLAAPETNSGARLLRRGYSYLDAESPDVEAGLFFLCYQRDLADGFVAVQRRLAGHDALNEYVTHTSSAVFACPPGVRPGDHWGDSLLA